MKGSASIPLTPPPPRDALRLRQLLGLLARPRLTAGHAAAVERLLGHPDWRPLPRLAAALPIEPLAAHHLCALGIPFEAAFAPDSSAAPLPDFRLLASNYALRRRALAEVLSALGEAGLERVLLVKGAALGPLWPSPALREMEDFDIVLDPHAVPSATRVLRRLGWRRRRCSWGHRSGVSLDLQVAASPFARHLLESSVPHPVLAAWGPTRLPTPAAHLLLLALHAAHHGGLRVWRDIADMQFHLEECEAPITGDALALAVRHDGRAALLAYLCVMEKWTTPPSPLLESAADPAVRRHARLLEHLMAEPLTEFGLYALDSLTPRSARILPAAAAAMASLLPRPGARPAGARESQRDPLWGTIPSAGRLDRQRAKAQVLLTVCQSGRLAHYRRLAAAIRRFSAPRVFDPAP